MTDLDLEAEPIGGGAPAAKRRVVAYHLVTVDGIASSPEEFVTDFDADMEAHLAEVIARQDLVLLGRRTYDEWASYWPNHPQEPFGRFINAVAKEVVTSSPPQTPWAHTTFTSEEPAAAVNRLGLLGGGEIGVHGSLTLSHELLARGLLDALHLVIVPVLGGAGRRLFPDSVPTDLEMCSAEVSSSGALLVHYEVVHRR